MSDEDREIPDYPDFTHDQVAHLFGVYVASLVAVSDVPTVRRMLRTIVRSHSFWDALEKAQERHKAIARDAARRLLDDMQEH